jgi:hypothetical protein
VRWVGCEVWARETISVNIILVRKLSKGTTETSLGSDSNNMPELISEIRYEGVDFK